MLIKFESSQSGTFVMQESVAKPLLNLMDRDTPQGAVTDEEIQEALRRLEGGLQRLAQAKQENEEHAEDDDDSEDLDASVDLHTRATPLLDMLRRANKENGYVMWRPD